MRVKTGFLLTALILPAAAQAQYGDPIPQIDARTGYPIIHGGIPGLPSIPAARYVAPSRLQPWASGISRLPTIRGVPDIPSVPDDYGRIGPSGIPGLPGPLGAPNILGDPAASNPFVRSPAVVFPRGAVGPYEPSVRFRGPGGILPLSAAIPDIRNPPQIPTAAIPPKFDYKFDGRPDLTMPPSTSWQAWNWSWWILPALAGAASAFRRQRSSDDRK
jgi:hypothetical protein